MANTGYVYEAEDGWRWHLKAGNNKIIAESGESYTTEAKAQAAYAKVFGVEDESAPATDDAAPKGASGGLGGLPDDPNHPLYSPLTVDSNKK